MSTDLEAFYRGVVADLAEFLPHGSLTWCQAASAEDVAVVLGGELFGAVPRSLSEARGEAVHHVQWSGHGKTLVIGALGSWFVAVEPDDWNGSEGLPRLSESGEAVSLYLGDTLRHYNLNYARGGEQLCRFRWGAEPDGDPSPLADLLSGLLVTSGTPPFDEWKMHALILVERITGVRLTAEWLNREHVRFVQGPHSRDVPPDDGELWP